MAKSSAKAKQKHREKLVTLQKTERDQLRAAIKSIHSTDEERYNAVVALNKMPRDSSPARLRNRCQLTGRPRGNYRKFGISRICFREMASHGLIPGVTKASW